MTQHPLEPLSADEFRRTTEILRRDGHVTDTYRFASIELMEPGKLYLLIARRDRHSDDVGEGGAVEVAAKLRSLRAGSTPSDWRLDRHPGGFDT